jgi:putative restriction endonuclease
VAALADYLDLTVGDAQAQFRMLLERRPVQQGRQVSFFPVETLLCLAASFLVNHRRFGGSTAHQAPEPVPSLARLFSRPPSSVLAKMANLDGSRSHGARWDVLAAAQLAGLVARVDAGELKIDVAERRPLTDLAPIHDEAVTGRLAGRTVLIP